MKKLHRVSRQIFILLFFISAIIAIISAPAFATITARIDYPEENGWLYGNVKISGVAKSTGDFNSYVLEAQQQPSGQWQTITQSNIQVPEPYGARQRDRDILGVWETGNGSFPAGEYKLRLTVYAESTSSTVTVNSVFLGTCSYVNNVSVNPMGFNPYAGETTTISYNLPDTGEVTLKFHDFFKNVIDTKNLGSQTAGAQSYIWNGRTGSGPGGAVADDAYNISIKVFHSGDQTTQIYYPADGAVDVTPTNVSISQSFKPQLNELCEIGYTIAQSCWVRIGVGTPQLMWAVLHDKFLEGSGYQPKLAGTYTDYWDGRKQLGDNIIIHEPDVQAVIWAHTLPDNVIITNGKTPTITNLQANPPIIDLTKGQGTDISYTLSRNMYVTITLWTNVSGTSGMQQVRTLISSQLRTAGSHTEHWDGLSDSGLFGAPPYPYTFKIEAHDVYGVNAETKYGSIVIKGY